MYLCRYVSTYVCVCHDEKWALLVPCRRERNVTSTYGDRVKRPYAEVVKASGAYACTLAESDTYELKLGRTIRRY